MHKLKRLILCMLFVSPVIIYFQINIFIQWFTVIVFRKIKHTFRRFPQLPRRRTKVWNGFRNQFPFGKPWGYYQLPVTMCKFASLHFGNWAYPDGWDAANCDPSIARIWKIKFSLTIRAPTPVQEVNNSDQSISQACNWNQIPINVESSENIDRNSLHRRAIRELNCSHRRWWCKIASRQNVSHFVIHDRPCNAMVKSTTACSIRVKAKIIHLAHCYRAAIWWLLSWCFPSGESCM